MITVITQSFFTFLFSRTTRVSFIQPSHVCLLQVDRGKHLGDAVQVLRHSVEGFAEFLRETRFEPFRVLTRYAIPVAEKPTDGRTDRQTDKQTKCNHRGAK